MSARSTDRKGHAEHDDVRQGDGARKRGGGVFKFLAMAGEGRDRRGECQEAPELRLSGTQLRVGLAFYASPVQRSEICLGTQRRVVCRSLLRASPFSRRKVQSFACAVCGYHIRDPPRWPIDEVRLVLSCTVILTPCALRSDYALEEHLVDASLRVECRPFKSHERPTVL